MVLQTFIENNGPLSHLYEHVRAFVQKTLTKTVVDDIEKKARIPRALWHTLGEHGLLGLTSDQGYGGQAIGYLGQVIVMEHISAASAALGLSYAAHTSLCMDQISRYANLEQKDKHLADLIAGRKIGALAMSELSAGSDVMQMQLAAKLEGEGYRLNGHKMWITNGPSADILLVYAKVIDEKHPDLHHPHLTAFIIEPHFTGFKREAPIDKLGMRGSETGKLIFQDCFVPACNVLGNVHQARRLLLRGLDYERLVLAAGPIGIMKSALDIAATYTHQREQFNRKIADFQLIQAKLADIYTALNSSRAYLYTLATACDQGSITYYDAASVLLYTSEQATKTALEAIQCLGAYGYLTDTKASRLLRDAKLYEIGAGTTEIRRILIARQLKHRYKDAHENAHDQAKQPII